MATKANIMQSVDELTATIAELESRRKQVEQEIADLRQEKETLDFLSPKSWTRLPRIETTLYGLDRAGPALDKKVAEVRADLESAKDAANRERREILALNAQESAKVALRHFSAGAEAFETFWHDYRAFRDLKGDDSRRNGRIDLGSASWAGTEVRRVLTAWAARDPELFGQPRPLTRDELLARSLQVNIASQEAGLAERRKQHPRGGATLTAHFRITERYITYAKGVLAKARERIAHA